ncbi:YbjN domain-containing protein [Actinoplanes sp. NPDC051494]|uniref:YbjN domain-containing protein n=1 Tax=Actinoplanes sp. NPDC051494 TaxID=3363907 RepID=UPI0037B12235
MSVSLQPLTNELITAVLKAREFAYATDDDGDIRGDWQSCLIYFFRVGQASEIIQVRILTYPDFSVDDVPSLYAFCNAWNHDRLWPKAYVHTDDDGVVRVVGEVSADFEHGVTQEQLDQVMICGIATGVELAEAVAALK